MLNNRPSRALLLALGILVGGCNAEHLMLARGTEVVDLGPAAIVPQSSPVVAPEGRSVVYLKAVSGSLPVVSRDLNTRGETTLFNVPSGSILWTLDYRTGHLLFSAGNGSGGRHVVEYSISGALVRDFTVPGGYQDYHACICPDGTALAFVRISDATQVGQLNIRATDDTNSTAQPLWTFINGEEILAVRWLDNTRLLVSGRTGSSALVNVIQNAETGVRSSAAGLALSATAAPDGQSVASLIGSQGATDIWLSRLNGEAMTRLTNSVGDKLSINWSQDGQNLVYETIRGQPPTSGLEVLSLPPLR